MAAPPSLPAWKLEVLELILQQPAAPLVAASGSSADQLLGADGQVVEQALLSRYAGGGGGGGSGGGGGGGSYGSSGAFAGAPVMSQGLINAAAMAGALGPGKVLEALNTVVLDTLQHHGEVGRLEAAPSKPPAFGFADLALAGFLMPPEVAADVLRGLQQAAPALALACLSSPKGFHHVVTLLMPLLAGLPDESEPLAAAADAFVAIGACMCEPLRGAGAGARHGGGESNEAAAAQLFRDFALPQIVEVLRAKPRRRFHALRVAYAFSGAAAARSSAGRVATITALQERLGDDRGVFVHCLAILASLETSLDMRLTDIYLYYAVIGMGAPSPLLRAAGVSILASIVDAAPAQVVGLLPRLMGLAEDSWWQVQAGLVEVSCGILRNVGVLRRAVGRRAGAGAGSAGAAAAAAAEGKHAEAADDAPAEAAHRALDLLHAVLAAEPGPAVLRVVVAHSAGLLDAFPAELVGAFVEAVNDVPDDARERLLGVSALGRASRRGHGVDRLPLRGPSEATIELPCVGRSLPHRALLPAFAEHARATSMQHLGVANFQLLLACVYSATDADALEAGHGLGGGHGHGGHDHDQDGGHGGGKIDPGELGALPPSCATLARELQDLVFVGLVDPPAFEAALELLRHLVLRLPEGGGLALLRADTLVGTLLLLHQPPTGQPSEHCKLAVASFLSDVAGRGKAAAHAVADLLRTFAARFPPLFETSPLRRVAEALRE